MCITDKFWISPVKLPVMPKNKILGARYVSLICIKDEDHIKWSFLFRNNMKRKVK